MKSRSRNESEQVCNTVYEEVCDSAQPSYNGGGASDSYGAAAPDEYGAAAAPLCRQEERQQCSTVPSQVLKIFYV